MRVTSARTLAYGLPYVVATLLLYLLPSTACSNQRPVIHVALAELSDSVVSLTVSGTLGTRALDGERRVLSSASSSFDVFLQSGDAGELTLEIGAVSDAGCQLGAGTSQLTISADTSSYDTTVTLSYDTTKQGCQLIVSKRGTGTGTVTGSVPCDFTAASVTSCAATFLPGTEVTIAATAPTGSYFAGWTGACTGTSSCTVTISSRPQTVSAGLLPAKLCVGSTCWEHPLPQGSDLTAVFGVSSDDLWFIGEGSTLLHWNGVYTEASTAPSSTILNAGWGSATDKVWVVGDSGTIFAWNGQSWQAEQSPTRTALYGIWGSSADSVWAVGADGTILQRSGGVWTAHTSGVTKALNGVWGSNASNVWAVGDGGTVLKWSQVSPRSC